MPLTKLTCPKCRAVLKPAKAVPEGKTIKCPKCEELFKAGEAPGAAAVKPAAAATKTADDEDGDQMYSVIRDEDEERKKAEAEERAARRKRRLKRKRAGEELDEDDEEDEENDPEHDLLKHYLESVKSKDPRGPAQMIVVGPGNWLLRTALVGFFGWVFYFIVFMIPVAFPNKEEDDPNRPKAKEKEKGKPGKFQVNDKNLSTLRAKGVPSSVNQTMQNRKGQEFPSFEAFLKDLSKDLDSADIEAIRKAGKEFATDTSIYHWWSAETILEEDHLPWSVLLFVFALVLGVTQAGLIAIGSVKMQSLESYRWALTACILTIIPMTTFPFFVFLTSVFDLIGMGSEGDLPSWALSLIVFLWGPLVGALCLKQFLQEKVKLGFDYRPD